MSLTASNVTNKLYGIERDLKGNCDEGRKAGREERSVPLLTQLKSWVEKTQPQVTAQMERKFMLKKGVLNS